MISSVKPTSIIKRNTSQSIYVKHCEWLSRWICCLLRDVKGVSQSQSLLLRECSLTPIFGLRCLPGLQEISQSSTEHKISIRLHRSEEVNNAPWFYWGPKVRPFHSWATWKPCWSCPRWHPTSSSEGTWRHDWVCRIRQSWYQFQVLVRRTDRDSKSRALENMRA